jgi:gliding motility-associated-like protein
MDYLCTVKKWLFFVFMVCTIGLAAQPCKNIKNTSQTLTTKCAKIHSILVDACGSPEGENEILLFYTGNSALTLSKLSLKWPTVGNNWLGLSQTTTTAKKVSDINATITGCGKLIEPVAGIVPANKRVYLFTSTNFIVGSNQFTNLNDTAYAIFQKSGNTSGHFANYSTPSGLRTAILTVSGVCIDTATYDKILLVKQSGSPGAEDGGFVNFDGLGNPTYLNNGCNAPSEPLKSLATALSPTTICYGDSIKLKGEISGGICFVWRSTKGRFSDSTSLTTTYFPDTGFSNPELWVFGCKGYVKSAVNIISKKGATVYAGKDTFICGSGIVKLNASAGGNPVLWIALGGKGTIASKTTAVTLYTPAVTDTLVRFLLSSYNGCNAQTDTMLAVWVPKGTASFKLSDTAICEKEDSVYVSGFRKGGLFTGASLSATPAFWPAIPGKYRITYTYSNKGCIDSSSKTIIVHPKPNAAFVFVPGATVNKGTAVSLMPALNWGYAHGWSENGFPVSNPVVKQQDGLYRITHRISDSITGCSDTASAVLKVISEEEIRMANVFTPNHDSLNEIFNFVGTGVKESNLKIFNRWGEKLFESDDQKIGWNGKTMNGVTCPEGVYFWQLSVQMVSGKKGYYSGTATLLR